MLLDITKTIDTSAFFFVSIYPVGSTGTLITIFQNSTEEFEMEKTNQAAYVVAFVLCLAFAGLFLFGCSNDGNKNPTATAAAMSDLELAQKISDDLITEAQFRELRPTLDGQVVVFKQVLDIWGFASSDEEIRKVLTQQDQQIPASDTGSIKMTGSCNRDLTATYGNQNVSYPIRTESPKNGECGNDAWYEEDMVLVYKTPGWPNTNTSNVFWWHDNSWYRKWLIARYDGKLSANGMCTAETRLCLGLKAIRLWGWNPYLYGTYLHYKR